MFTLLMALQFAIDHSPTLNSAARQAAIADLQYKNSVTTFLPSLDLSATDGFKRTKIPDTPLANNPYASDLNLGLTETLYDNGNSITNYKIAVLTAELQKIAYEGARGKLCLDVSVAFYKYSLSQKLRDMAEQRLKTLERQFGLVSSQYRQGLKARPDYLRFKTQVQRAQLDLLQSTSDAHSAEAEIRRLMGMPPTADEAQGPPAAFQTVEPRPFDPGREIPTQSPPLEKAYEYRTGNLQRRVNDLQENFSHRLYWPQINVTAGAGYDNNGYLGPGTRPFATGNTLSWQGQLSLTYNIWDWGTRARNVEIAQQNHAVQDNAVTSTNLQTRENIDTLMLQMRTLQENYKTNVELLDLSQQSYDFLEQEYRRGRSTYLDIITGLSDLLDAKTRYLNSYYGLMQNLAQYRYFEGTLYDTIRAEK